MGACGSKAPVETIPENTEGGTLGLMFRRMDKGNTGFLTLMELKEMMKDDKHHFKGKDAGHIMEKYGTDGKMSFQQFSTWWNSTYTTYNNDAIADLVNAADADHMESIAEAGEVALPVDKHLTNKAVGRS